LRGMQPFKDIGIFPSEQLSGLWQREENGTLKVRTSQPARFRKARDLCGCLPLRQMVYSTPTRYTFDMTLACNCMS
jgi:hypothetical protein